MRFFNRNGQRSSSHVFHAARAPCRALPHQYLHKHPRVSAVVIIVTPSVYALYYKVRCCGSILATSWSLRENSSESVGIRVLLQHLTAISTSRSVSVNPICLTLTQHTTLSLTVLHCFSLSLSLLLPINVYVSTLSLFVSGPASVSVSLCVHCVH